MESGAERAERLHEHTEYADEQHEERAAAWGRGVCQGEQAAATGHRVHVRRPHRLTATPV